MDASAQTITAQVAAQVAAQVPTKLLAWYDVHHRALAWRNPPGSPPPPPYRVWLSEVMLQQTTTAAAAPYFARFLARWPDVHALAAADEGEVMAAWAGLGYYARARNLIACAREVAARGGAFPPTEAELRTLPGLGAYTAAAVAAIAFGQRAAVVDANVERVIARLYAIVTPLHQARAAIRGHVEALTPAARPGDFAQAMMDLGATICTPRNPRCSACPLSAACQGRAQGAEQFPVKLAKPPKPQRRGQAFWIARQDQVWLVRRVPSGLLGGMLALPDDGWNARADGNGRPPLPPGSTGGSTPDSTSGSTPGSTGDSPGNWTGAGTVRHSFTHFDLDLQLMVYSGGDWSRLAGQAGQWWPLDRLDDAGLPTVFAKAARLVLAA